MLFPPTNVICANAGGGVVYVCWNDPASGSVATIGTPSATGADVPHGYNVYCTLASGGDWSLMNPTPRTEQWAAVRNVHPDQTIYTTVVVADEFGTESERSELGRVGTMHYVAARLRFMGRAGDIVADESVWVDESGGELVAFRAQGRGTLVGNAADRTVMKGHKKASILRADRFYNWRAMRGGKKGAWLEPSQFGAAYGVLVRNALAVRKTPANNQPSGTDWESVSLDGFMTVRLDQPVTGAMTATSNDRGLTVTQTQNTDEFATTAHVGDEVV